jgi:plastocyanin
MKHPSKRRLMALIVGGMFLLTLGPALAVAADGSVSIIEEDEKYKYTPAGLTVALGTTVTWTNDSDAEHTVTADDNSFDHDGIGTGETASQTFDTPGEFPYHCDLHDYMHGTVTVLAADQTPPATDVAAPAGPTQGATPWFAILAGLAALIVLSGWVLLPRRTERN